MCLSSFLSQLPRQITINSGEYHHHLPVEVAGWIIKALGCSDGSDFLVISSSPLLALGLAVCGPVTCNVFWGDSRHSHDQVKDIAAEGEVLMGIVRRLKLLPVILFNLHRPYINPSCSLFCHLASFGVNDTHTCSTHPRGKFGFKGVRHVTHLLSFH